MNGIDLCEYEEDENVAENAKLVIYEKGGLDRIKSRSQELVCDLYQQLHASDVPHLLTAFENVIFSVIRDIRTYQSENERLERSYKRDKDQHVQHLRQLEEDMEAQMSRVDARVRKEEQEKGEAEREDLRQMLQAEIAELQNNLKRLQKMDQHAQRSPSDDFKARMDEILHDNRQLKSQLTDLQTNLALSRSDLTSVRQEYEEKCYEVETEKDNMLEYIAETDNLRRQVHLLQDANKKLHDTNDDLRSALETSRLKNKRPWPRPPQRSISGTFIHDSPTSPTSPMSPFNRSGSSLADELNMSDPYGRRSMHAHESCDIESIPEDIDSGHSTLRDVHEIDSEYEPNSIEDDVIPYTPRKRNRINGGFDSTTESEVQSQDEMDADLDEVDGDLEHDDVMMSVSRPSSVASSQDSYRRQTSMRRRLPPLPITKTITANPERMYKIVLAGDAAVGKSSFILRLCKNKFLNNMNTTLGVDFQTKTLEVDGRVIALQLWDTAGQERFRSIAKSYFRRADGVLLLYDVTYERSFINVRDWMTTIEEGAQKKIPIMVCGNKTDMRDEISAERKTVSKEEGTKLAKDYDAVFIETSAKDGNNVMEAVIELARLLRTHEDLEVKSVGMKLRDMEQEKVKKSTSCCNK